MNQRHWPHLLLFFLIAASVVPPARATTYYVDNCVVTGNDSNAGTSTSAPWLTIAKVNGFSFATGDSVLFEKTCTWAEELTIPTSSFTVSAYGTGTNPIITGSAARAILMLINGRSNVTVSNLTFTNSATGNYGVVRVVDSNYITLNSLIVHDNVNYAGIYMEGSGSYNTVENSTIYNTTHATSDRGAGIILDGAGGHHTLTGNTIYSNSANGIKLAMFTATSNNEISKNTLYRNGSSGININATCGSNIVEYNVVYQNGQLIGDRYNIDLYKAGNNNLIRYNLTWAHNYISLDAGGIRFDGGDPPGSFGTGNVAYSNVMYNEHIGFTVMNDPSGGAIYNNTIYNSTLHGIHIHGSTTIGLIAKNNLVDIAGTHLIFNEDAIGSVVDYNLYYPDAAAAFNWNGSTYNFSGWKTNSSQDADSPAPADPKLANPTGLEFWPAKTSPAIDAGVNLGAPYNIALLWPSSWPASVVTGDQDAYGAGWEIGAYVFPSTPISACDLNRDGVVNVVDVQLEVNQALGIAACTNDINQDGACNVIDVQRVVNAALGGACVTIP